MLSQGKDVFHNLPSSRCWVCRATRYRVENGGVFIKQECMVEDNYWFRNDDDFLSKKDTKLFGCLYGTLSAVVMFILLLMLFLLAGCRSVKYVPVIEHRTDTCYITKHQRDSIWLHDSIHVKEQVKGDSTIMLVEKWHTKYIEKEIHDTTYIAKIDSIPTPYPVEVKVARELTWWQKTLQRTGAIALALLGGWIVWNVWKIYKRRF